MWINAYTHTNVILLPAKYSLSVVNSWDCMVGGCVCVLYLAI